MSDTNVETLEENEEKGEKSEEENVVINIEPKRKPRKKMSPEDHAAGTPPPRLRPPRRRVPAPHLILLALARATFA